MAFNPSNKKNKLVAEINVTPLVDVMLVLLIIFMVSAPMMYNGIKLKLPKTSKVDSLNLNTEQVILSVSETAEFFIGKNKILKDELTKEIKSELKLKKQGTLFLRAHYRLKYGLVAKLISVLKKSGISQIALVTETESE